MLSYDTKLKLAETLLVFAEQERQIESARQILCEQPTFSPYAAFRRLDRERKGFITPEDIHYYLEDHSTTHSIKFCEALVHKYSSQDELELNYTDFIRTVLPQSNPKLRTETTQRPDYDVQEGQCLPRNVEQLLVDVYDKELAVLLANENLKHNLAKRYDYNNLDAFAAIDKLQTDRIDYDNLKRFFKEMNIFPKQNDLLNIIRSICKNDDGIVTYEEFSDAFRIVEPYLANTIKASPSKYYKLHKETPPKKSQAFNAVSTAKRWQLPPPGINEPKQTPRKETIKEIIEFYISPQKFQYSALSARSKSPISEEKALRTQRVISQVIQARYPVSDSKPVQSHRRSDTSSNAEIYKEVFKQIASPSKNRSTERSQQQQIPKSVTPFKETTLEYANTSTTKYYGADVLKNTTFTLDISPIGKVQQRDTYTSFNMLAGQKTPNTRTHQEMNFSGTKEKLKQTESTKQQDSSVIKAIRIDMDPSPSSVKESQVLANYFKQLIYMEKDVEMAKQDLALRPDFNLLDFFRVFDVEGRGAITKGEFQRGLEKFGLGANNTEISLFFRRYDRDNDGRLK